MKKIIVMTALFLMGCLVVTPVSIANAASTGLIEKDCTAARFSGTVAAGEVVRLAMRLHDTADWQSPRLQDDYIVISDPGPYDVTVPWVDDPAGRLNRTAIAVSVNGGLNWANLALNEDFLDCGPDGEGCTPGYWKNHLEDWPATGLSPYDYFEDTFGVYLNGYDIVLGMAIRARGGGVKKLARHGTAALLSALHPDVGYPYTAAEVISMVQAGDVEPLVYANELGCEIP